MENKCTLVVVDFQYDFCTGGSLPVPGSDMALARISNLISSGQVDNVIFTVDWHPANHCSFKRNGGQWVDHCLQFTNGAAIADPLVRSCVRLGIPYQVIRKGEKPDSDEYGAFSVITDKRGYYLAQTATDSCRIPQWRQGERILKENEFIIVDASHFDNSSLDYRTTENIIYAPDIDICSTTIRNMVKEGKIIAPFVTDEISELIYNHQLYK